MSTDDSSIGGDDSAVILYNEPLFCYYFRLFLSLYKQVMLLKPVLIQECVSDNPWKLLVVTVLLNKTAGKLAIPVFWKIMAKWPTPWALSRADVHELINMLWRLGTQRIRAKRLISLSKAYLLNPPRIHDLRRTKAAKGHHGQTGMYPSTPVSHLPGTGPYALDSYRIFCTTYHKSVAEEWKAVMPKDKELIRYLKWKWAFVERQEWVPGQGAIQSVGISYLRKLVSELSTKTSSSETGFRA